MKDREYHKEYYTRNKEVILAKNRAWRLTHKEQINEQKRCYESSPDRKAKRREKSAREYQEKKEVCLARQAKRRRERKEYIDRIAMQQGCRNPDCKWRGEFNPCQLTFHHVDPSMKEIEVAKMHSWSFESIVAEIRKCCVLCRNCHPLADIGVVKVEEDMVCNLNEEAAVETRIGVYGGKVMISRHRHKEAVVEQIGEFFDSIEDAKAYSLKLYPHSPIKVEDVK